MCSNQIAHDVPKKLAVGRALKTPVSNILSLRLKKVLKISKFPKIFLGVYLVLYLLGYQPTLAVLPLKKNVVQAQFTQEQSIESLAYNQTFILPHPGYLSTRFSSWHPGVDIATGLGMPIKAIAGGKVKDVQYGFWGLGHHVVVGHEYGYTSTYGHMGRVFVSVGDTVTPSTILGEVGMTGNTSGPHTHLEIAHNDNRIDPQTILPSVSNIPDYPSYQASIASSSSTAHVKNSYTTASKPITKSIKVAPKPVSEVKIDLKKELSFNL